MSEGVALSYFKEAFAGLTGFAEPFKWQQRLFLRFINNDLPDACDLPTGLGKTSVMAIWFIARKWQEKQGKKDLLPTRLVYVVDRRAVVDQATSEAEKIKKWADGQGDGAGLRVSTLRGQYADNREWLEDPSAPAIIVGTVDMIGSRLLFSGYGVSHGMRPCHAGLLGVDALVALDESHLVPPFEKLLLAIHNGDGLGPVEEADRKIIPRFRLLPLSATGGREAGDTFRIEAEDWKDKPVAQRLNAKKRLEFRKADENKLTETLAKEAWALSDNGTKARRILVYCNSRDVAEKVKAEIEKHARKEKADIEIPELFVGARRVKERENAKSRLEELGFFSGNEAPDKPAFVIATSAGEVGVDLDADHMVMDLVPFERMVQRLGRVNRLGDKDAHIVALETPDKNLPDDLKQKAAQCLSLLKKLPGHEDDDSHDASPGALKELKERFGDAAAAASTPEPLYPALTRPLVDAWSMTSLAEHAGRPEVQPWLRGWEANEIPQTTLIWRKYLPVRLEGDQVTKKEVADFLKEIADFFEAAPPHLTEKLETRVDSARDWLGKRLKKYLDDIEKKGSESIGDGKDTRAPLKERDVVAVLLGNANDKPQPYSLERLVAVSGDKRQFERVLSGMTLVLDARLGGLSGDGLLDASLGLTCASAADGENGWLVESKEKPGDKRPLVPLRISHQDTNAESDEDEEKEPPEDDADWRPIHRFALKRDDEGNATEELVIEKWHDEPTTEDARGLSSRAQKLDEHQEWAGEKAHRLVKALRLDEAGLGEAIILAARLHDEGKKAQRWQQAFRTPADGRPYAKSGNRRPPDHAILDGYRHEFGSLFHVERDNRFGGLPDDLREMVLHLVAAHHGYARPVIRTDGCEEAPPSVLAARARDVALRYARLQKRFGPWGLAWLEAVLRAADQQASRDLDKEGARDG